MYPVGIEPTSVGLQPSVVTRLPRIRVLCRVRDSNPYARKGQKSQSCMYTSSINSACLSHCVGFSISSTVNSSTGSHVQGSNKHFRCINSICPRRYRSLKSSQTTGFEPVVFTNFTTRACSSLRSLTTCVQISLSPCDET